MQHYKRQEEKSDVVAKLEKSPAECKPRAHIFDIHMAALELCECVVYV